LAPLLSPSRGRLVPESAMSLRHEQQTSLTLALQFRKFSENECRLSSSPFYGALCARIAEDTDLLDIAKSVRVGQRAPNMFLAAVQYLVLAQDKNPLKAAYVDVGNGVPAHPDFFYDFKAFCLDSRDQIAGIMSTRAVQTNEVRRSATFLPALFLVERRVNFMEFHFIDVGCSAGLNLLWHRYHYRYSNGASCGDESSEIHILCDVHGDISPPLRNELPKTASRVGIEIYPVDVFDPDNVNWLKALIWPDQRDRVDLLEAALAVLKKEPPRIVAGDCAEKIPEIVSTMPGSDPVCLLFSHSANQAFREGRKGLASLLSGLSEVRKIFEVSIGHFEEAAPVLILSEYENGRMKSEERLATTHPHGNWIRWNRRQAGR
jgi:hypothetical protein